MTMTGNNEDILRNTTASYLDIAEVIQQYGANVKEDLAQLWKRVVFNILISNTDDHLRNHGFILSDKGWLLSPAYDINPSIDKNGLSLNIDMDNNDLDIELAKSVGKYFRLNNTTMNNSIEEVKLAVKQWKILANESGISKFEQEIMSGAFKS
jgi:serine/threonine-protein kinase HipA